MELTDKCKKDFEKWYNKELYNKAETLAYFYIYTPSMQHGVYVDFFDSVGIYIEIERYILNKENKWGCRIDEGNLYDTRLEARIEAIKQANKIYNEI